MINSRYVVHNTFPAVLKINIYSVVLTGGSSISGNVAKYDRTDGFSLA
jgi:hypothetical protein